MDAVDRTTFVFPYHTASVALVCVDVAFQIRSPFLSIGTRKPSSCWSPEQARFDLKGTTAAELPSVGSWNLVLLLNVVPPGAIRTNVVDTGTLLAVERLDSRHGVLRSGVPSLPFPSLAGAMDPVITHLGDSGEEPHAEGLMVAIAVHSMPYDCCCLDKRLNVNAPAAATGVANRAWCI